MTVKVVESASQTQHLFLPLIAQGTEPGKTCSELLVNGGAESDQAWELLGGWPGVCSSLHVQSGDGAIRLGAVSTWQPMSLDLTDYRGETVTLRYTVLNENSPGIIAGRLDDISLSACEP